MLKKIYSFTFFALVVKIVKIICEEKPEIISSEALHTLSTKKGRSNMEEMINECKKELKNYE